MTYIIYFFVTAPICGENLGITVLLVKNMIPNLKRYVLKLLK